MNLHDAIMRMETISEQALSELCEDMHPPHAYERGFGDARRGAAELASAFEEHDPAPALLAARADAERYTEFEVQDADGIVQAVAHGPRDLALREALHYAVQYGNDGPVRVFEVFRVEYTNTVETE